MARFSSLSSPINIVGGQEALKKKRNKGQVQRVNVASGGQADVGNVTTYGSD
ncbi:MAG: hypothetical protein AB1Y26_07455 [Cycloclasticus sp.]